MNHKELDVWKTGIKLCVDIYKWTKQLPAEEKYCLTSQMRQAAISVPCNIAEGAAKSSDKDFLRFCEISRGSMAELETLLIMAWEVYEIQQDKILESLYNQQRLLGGFIRYLRKKV